MKVNRSQLEEILVQKFETIKSDLKFTEDLKNELAKHKILAGDVQRIISQNIPIQEIDDTMLFLFTNAIYVLTSENIFNPELYFNEREIQIASRYEEYHDDKIKLPLVIDNVLSLNDKEFITVLPIKTLVEWDNSLLIEYNHETQRNPKERKNREGKIVPIANINPQSVKEITQHILNNTFKADTLILNVLSDGNDEIMYDPKHGRLTIVSGEIDILDGFHRLNAFSQVINNFNPDADLKVQVAIKNFTIKEAQAYVAQINTVNKMPNTYIQKLKADRYSDIVAKELQKESELKNRVSPTHLVNHNVGHLVSYKLLTDEIEEQFKINSKIEAMDLADYLTVFFDYLIGSFPEEFARDKSGETIMSKHFMFIGYITLARHMYENNIPARSVVEVISQIDLTESNPFFDEVKKMNAPLSNKRFKKFVREYFNQIPLEGV
ncbi:hypothetical protein EDM57_04755 [Brevibacillus gelatini]|uniref:DGQHR domain-containing protein n=1 Tax=Brevibacillus gelatini TaxID=1655277 RepID=A0A3M8B7P2_9BACL|nr:DNA sulfur modification protein DndB [Brevibacillus gelatini]RNB59456.1 hypothetical protein EDM57_04755 [Brevibacillus gelatini]